MPTLWTDARVEQLCELYREGLSSRVIGERMQIGRHPVALKIDKLIYAKVLVRRSPVRENPPPPGKHARKFNPAYTAKTPPSVPEPDTLEPLLIDGKPVTIRTCNDRTCRWPMSDASADMVMCGRAPVAGKPYCPDHDKRVHQPQQAQAARQRQAERTAEAAA